MYNGETCLIDGYLFRLASIRQGESEDETLAIDDDGNPILRVLRIDELGDYALATPDGLRFFEEWDKLLYAIADWEYARL